MKSPGCAGMDSYGKMESAVNQHCVRPRSKAGAQDGVGHRHRNQGSTLQGETGESGLQDQDCA